MTTPERISKSIWKKVKKSWKYNLRLGEETFTDFLSVDMADYAPENVKLFKTTKREEAQQGTDLEIILNFDEHNFVHLAIQAKKLYPSGKYPYLNTRVRGTEEYQIKILEKYSKLAGAIPLYLFYNYVDDNHEVRQRWHCGQRIKIKQLGCTLVPSWRIWKAIAYPECRTFMSIHLWESALPWRCLFGCPKLKWRELYNSDLRNFLIDQYRDWPHLNQQHYDWLINSEFEPVLINESFAWLWKREAGVLKETELTEYYRLRKIDREELLYPVELYQDVKLVDLIPRRILLVKLAKLDKDKDNPENLQ